MTEQVNKSLRIRAPNDRDTGSAGNYAVGKYTLETSSIASELPAAWSGQWVSVKPVGGTCMFAFGSLSNAAVNISATASTDGNFSSVGHMLADGEEVQRQLPTWEPTAGQKCFFVRQGGTASTYVILGRV
jgi:hypothetical protein